MDGICKRGDLDPDIFSCRSLLEKVAENEIGLKKIIPHSCYFSDELGVSNFFIKIQNWCLLYVEAYGTIKTWKKIYLLLRETHFHMVEDMFILYSTILSSARNIENRF